MLAAMMPQFLPHRMCGAPCRFLIVAPVALVCAVLVLHMAIAGSSTSMHSGALQQPDLHCTAALPARGVAVVSGLVACPGEPAAAAEGVVAASQDYDRMYPVVVKPCCSEELVEAAAQESAEGMAAALVSAGQMQPLELSLSVQPSTLPATLVLAFQGEVRKSRMATAAAGWIKPHVHPASTSTSINPRCHVVSRCALNDC